MTIPQKAVSQWDAAPEQTERLRRLGLMVVFIVHDLRNQATVIQGITDLASDGMFPANMLPALRRSMDRLGGLLQNLLDYARGTDALAPRVVPVAELLMEMKEGALGRLRMSGVHLELRVPVAAEVLLADPPRLVRALSNLIDNAREAMPGGGTLIFEIEGTKEAILFRIADTGKGIPPDILPRIFEPFVTYEKDRGTGLGTAIANDIVAAHGGSIAVTSTLGVGTTFEVRIPRGAMEPPWTDGGG
jgi:signal transduction histidine kinase